MNLMAEAAQYAHESRAQSLVEIMHHASLDTLSWTPDQKAWQEKRKELQQLQIEIETSNKEDVFDFNGSRHARYQARTSSLQQQIRDLESALDPVFLSQFTVIPMSYTDMQQALGPTTLAFMWYFSEHWSGVFVISQQLNVPRFVAYDQSEVSAIEADVGKFQAALKSRDISIVSQCLVQLPALLKLDAIMKCVEDKSDGQVFHFPHYTQLALIPHSLVSVLPLASMNIPGSRIDFTDKFTDGVFYIPSLQLLQQARQSPMGLQRVAAVCDPTLDLPGALQEVAKVYEMFGPSNCTVLKQEQATLASVRQMMSQAQPNSALHVACHGKYDAFQRWNSHLVMANKERLTVADIMQMDLKNIDLCVLSACESGISDAISNNYEDHIGLTTASYVAGVPRIVSTLWPINDASTALLMALLYEQLKKRVPISSAVRNAQDELRALRVADVPTRFREVLGHERGVMRHQTCTVHVFASSVSDTAVCEIQAAFIADLCQQLSSTSTEDSPELSSQQLRQPGEKFGEESWKKLFSEFSTDPGVISLTHNCLFPMKPRKANEPESFNQCFFVKVCFSRIFASRN